MIILDWSGWIASCLYQCFKNVHNHKLGKKITYIWAVTSTLLISYFPWNWIHVHSVFMGCGMQSSEQQQAIWTHSICSWCSSKAHVVWCCLQHLIRASTRLNHQSRRSGSWLLACHSALVRHSHLRSQLCLWSVFYSQFIIPLLPCTQYSEFYLSKAYASKNHIAEKSFNGLIFLGRDNRMRECLFSGHLYLILMVFGPVVIWMTTYSQVSFHLKLGTVPASVYICEFFSIPLNLANTWYALSFFTHFSSIKVHLYFLICAGYWRSTNSLELFLKVLEISPLFRFCKWSAILWRNNLLTLFPVIC